MVRDEKIEIVSVNGVITAVRISFNYNNRYYARQYAINAQMQQPEAIVQCTAYRNRVLLRSGVSKEAIAEMLNISKEDAVHQLKVHRQHPYIRNVGAVQRAIADVAHVLATFAPNPEHSMQYTNVYGVPSNTKTTY